MAVVNRISCGVMTVGVSVNIMMLSWNLEDILLIFSRNTFEKVEANVLEHRKVGKMEGLFWDKRESRPAHSFLGLFLFSKTKFL